MAIAPPKSGEQPDNGNVLLGPDAATQQAGPMAWQAHREVALAHGEKNAQKLAQLFLRSSGRS